MPQRSILILILAIALSLTSGLCWFALQNYYSAVPVADDTLRGLALTVASAMEGVADRDPSLQSLASFQGRETAYAMLISGSGEILYHSNQELIGTAAADDRYLPVLKSATFSEGRIRLGTGEQVYEFQTPFHLSGETCVLRLALHTWRYEAVMRRARFGVTLIFSLLALGWGLGITVMVLLRRQSAQNLQLARQNELARLGEVGAVLAHEVRNPLAGIKGYGQLLEERLPDGTEKGFARMIVEESLRMENMVNDILLYTRAEPMPPSEFRLDTVVSSLSGLVAHQAAEAGIRLVCTVPENLTLLCPEEGIRRVLLNLITNSLQATPRDGLITVTAERDGAWAVISVADNGCGIPAGMLPVLFEPFRTSKARGAGLGLAVSKKIVEACRGKISVHEVPGGGALFVVRLPIAGKEG